jgi:hypothetical protein
LKAALKLQRLFAKLVTRVKTTMEKVAVEEMTVTAQTETNYFSV